MATTTKNKVKAKAKETKTFKDRLEDIWDSTIFTVFLSFLGPFAFLLFILNGVPLK